MKTERARRPYSRPHTREDARRENRMTALCDSLRAWSDARGPDGRRAHLDQLWRNWDMVMGAYLAPIALPLGQREGVLLVGAEDHYMLHELAYSTPDILQRVNAFMGEDLFHKVDLQLLMGALPLNRIRLSGFAAPPPPARPEHLGTLLGILDPSSPVGRCYAAYVRFFTRTDRAGDHHAGQDPSPSTIPDCMP